MGRFRNFRIWRGKLPHWRADGETYFATFRHRRSLEPTERSILLKRLLAANTKRWVIQAAAVADDSTQIIFRMMTGSEGHELELSDVLEKAKRKAGNDIIKRSGERFPPFYTESFDRIIRDEEEYETRIAEILELSENDDDIYIAPAVALQKG